MLLGARQFFERRGAPTPPLPYDAEVEYLESTGTQWIDTGISLTFPMACDMTFSIDTNYGTTTSIPVFGIRISTNAKYAFWVSKTDGKLALNYGKYDSGFAGGDVRSFANVYNVGAKMYCNDALICDGRSPILENDSRTLYMFTLNDYGSASIRGSRFKIARATISNGIGDQVDFIPVRVGSGASAVGYMYDRISGALFRNQGTGEFVIGPDKVAWTNPYVTDGLVAMWDGEWNAGGGVHDPNGGLVEILSGTETYLRRGTYTVEEDCIRCAAAVVASQSIPSIVALAGGELTVEACLLNDTDTTPSGRIGNFGSGRPFAGDMFTANGAFYMVHDSCTESGFTSSWSTGWKTTRQYRAVTVSQDTVQFWVNGVANNSAAKTKQVETTTNPFSLFGWDWDYHFPASGDLCSIRIYSRALTASEIAANYAIDKARFNLP